MADSDSVILQIASGIEKKTRIKMYQMEKSEIMSEIPKKANDLVTKLKIDLNMLRKK